jgi:hypothetical protein
MPRPDPKHGSAASLPASLRGIFSPDAGFIELVDDVLRRRSPWRRIEEADDGSMRYRLGLDG